MKPNDNPEGVGSCNPYRVDEFVVGLTQGSAGRATLGGMIESFQDADNAHNQGIVRFNLAPLLPCALALNFPAFICLDLTTFLQKVGF